MQVSLHIARFAAALFGAALLYMSYTMTEATEGVWTNKLEAFWVRVDDRSKSTGSTTIAFFEKLAQVVERLITSVLGQKLVSYRSFIASFFISIACCLAVLGVLSALVLAAGLMVEPSWKQAGLLLFVVIFCGFGIVAYWRFARSVAMATPFGIGPIGMFTLIFVVVPLVKTYRNPRGGDWVLSLAIFASGLSNVILIAAVRRSITRMRNDATATTISSSLITQGLVFALLFVLPWVAFLKIDNSDYGFAFLVFGVLNVSTIIASLTFSLAIATALVHRLVWPLLSSWAYVLTRREVLDKRKTVRTIGWFLVALPFASTTIIAALEKALK